MNAVYNFVTGPLAWAAFIIFIAGCIGRLIYLLYLTKNRDQEVLRYLSLKYSLRSILHWILPFGSRNWQKHPLLTLVTFIFHICLILVPIFLCAHIILWNQFWGVDFWSLPNNVADIMTILVILSCVFFALRRALLKQVSFVTSFQDWLVLVIVFLPFITGFLAYHQIFNYQIMLVLHIIFGEIFLISIPFTRLTHMLYAPLIRAYTGSEFGGIRKARDW